MTDIATLGFAIDSRPLQQADSALQGVANSAGQVQTATGQMQQQFRATTASTAALASATTRLTATQQASRQALTATGQSAKQTAQAMRQLPAQITDIFTGLAGGQSPFLVLIQQGGQLRDSFGGVGAATRALASALTPLRLILGGTGAALAAVVYGFIQGRQESLELERALINTGRTAGVTAGQLSLIADAVSNLAGGTHGQAADVLAGLISTGTSPGCATRPYPSARFRAYAIDTPASSIR